VLELGRPGASTLTPSQGQHLHANPALQRLGYGVAGEDHLVAGMRKDKQQSTRIKNAHCV
jgi:hypothetical protein